MSINKQIKLACWAQAAAVLVAQFFALHTGSATAQTVGAQVNVAQPSPARQVAASVAATPASAASAACAAPAALVHFDRPLVHTMRRLANGQPLTIVAIG